MSRLLEFLELLWLEWLPVVVRHPCPYHEAVRAAETALAEQPARAADTVPEVTPEHAPASAPAPEATTPTQSEQPAAEQPGTGEQTAPAQDEQPVQGEASADPNAAPILDSQKDTKRPRKGDKQPTGQSGEQAITPPVPVDQDPPPADDKAARARSPMLKCKNWKA